MHLRVLSLVLLLTLGALVSRAQEKIIRLYDGPAPGSENWKQTEKTNAMNMWQTRVVFNVVNPTLTYFPAASAKANGTSVIVCPGGAFHALSIDSEGNDVARWLAEHGVAAFVLKYRLVESKTDDPTTELMQKGAKMGEDAQAVVPLAMADGLAAVSYVRKHAADFGLKPDRVGIIGFSAGGTVAAAVAYNYTAESRPNFAAPIYLAYNWVPKKETVPADAPPLFVSAASDDPLGLASHSIDIYNAWLKARKPVELHMYAKGGHGFGMRKQNLPSDQWIERFYAWLIAQDLAK